MRYSPLNGFGLVIAGQLSHGESGEGSSPSSAGLRRAARSPRSALAFHPSTAVLIFV